MARPVTRFFPICVLTLGALGLASCQTLQSSLEPSAGQIPMEEASVWPARFPFPLMHIDTGHNFPEALEYRDRRVEELGARLIVAIGAGRDRRRPRGRAGRPATSRATAFRRPSCSTRSPRTSSTPRSAAPAATRSAPAPRSASSRSATSTASGTRSSSAPSSGTSTTAATARASTCACSRSRTGPSSTSGSTSPRRASSCRRSTSRTSGSCSERDGMLLADSEHIERRPDEEPFKARVRFRTIGDMNSYRRGRVRGRHGRARDRGDRRHADHRARRDPRRRPHLAGRDGRPQARGLLLVAGAAQNGDGPAPRRRRSRSPRSRAARACCAWPPPARSTTARAR